jgi:hypothetical protein
VPGQPLPEREVGAQRGQGGELRRQHGRDRQLVPGARV